MNKKTDKMIGGRAYEEPIRITILNMQKAEGRASEKNMITCSFLGNWQMLDTEKYVVNKIKSSFQEIFRHDNQILFYSLLNGIIGGGKFNQLFNKIVNELQNENPNKTIVLTYITGDIINEDLKIDVKQPIGIIDKPYYCEAYHLSKWMIEQSNYLISYIYEPLGGQLNKLFLYAKKRPDLRVLDITNEDTVQRILKKAANELNAREKNIFFERNNGNGKTLLSIGKELQISAQRTREIYVRAASKIVIRLGKDIKEGRN